MNGMRRAAAWLALAAVVTGVMAPGSAIGATIGVEGDVCAEALAAEAEAAADVAEQTAISVAIIGQEPTTSVDTRIALAKPVAGTHPDVAPDSVSVVSPEVSVSALGADRTNNISFEKFASGDIVVVLGTVTGHAGVFDRAYYSSIFSNAVWSANKTSFPLGRVLREQCLKYRSYPVAYGLGVPSKASRGSQVRYYCRAQNGEPYDITSSKRDQSRWYCSKLAWAGWRWIAGVDLDADGGYYVWPVDLLNDSQTKVFGRWT